MDIDTSEHKKLLLILWEATNNLNISSDDRSRLGIGCLQLSQDHHAGIILLIENSLYSSAFALLRTQFESFIRGLWILRLASNEEIEHYQEDCCRIKIAQMIDAISTLPHYNDNEFSSVASSIKTMNSYTHSGYVANLNHQDANYIQPNHQKEEILKSLNFSNFIGKLATIEVVEYANDGERGLDKLFQVGITMSNSLT
jgi:hypothetical protein